MLSKAVGTKSISQIKNYYYDYKKQSGKYTIKSEKKNIKPENNTPKSVSSDFPPQDEDDDIDDVQEDSAAHSVHANPPYFPNLGSKNLKQLGRPMQHGDATAPPVAGLAGSLRNVADIAQREQLLFQDPQDRIGATQRIAPERFVSEPENRVDGVTTAPTDGFVGDSLVAKLRASQQGLAERLLTGPTDLSGANQNELLQQLLNQQAQQRHGHQLDVQYRQQQQQQQPQQPQQQPQSALQQLLSRQHHQREHQQLSSQRSLEEARRLLQQPSQSHHQQQVLSNLFPSWSTGSQLLHAQNRMQHAQLAAALQQEGGSLGSSVSDLAEGKYHLVRR
jgi:hypothetical protein